MPNDEIINQGNIERQEPEVMRLERLLIVNDDLEDIRRIQARLPEQFVVEMASQSEARMIRDFEHDMIIVDNDANERQDAKGPGTLGHIRDRRPDVPVLYTSFQPGMVDPRVQMAPGVQIVKSDELVPLMVQLFGFQPREAPEQVSQEPLVSLILSYNPIEGYGRGIHEAGDRRVIVLGYDKHAYDDAPRVVREQMDEIYGHFDFRRDRDLIRNIFVYDGINAGDIPGQMASILGHDVRMVVNLMACHCDWGRKERLGNNTYVDIFPVECSGSESMGMVVDLLLGVRRPDADYDRLSIPENQVLAPARKFRL